MEEKSLKFLFIHYHYPPIRNSGVYRNYYLSGALSQATGKSYLITTDNRKYLPNEPLPLHQNISRIESFTFDYRRIIGWLNGVKSKSGAQFTEDKKSSFFISWFIKIQRSFPFNLFLAEGALLYIIHGFLTGSKLIREQNVNIVFSSFMPYSDHIIAYLLKIKYPNIKWVADFRDLHIEPIYKNTIWVPFQKWTEKKILKKADFITCVSDGISKKMMKYHENVITIFKGVDLRPIKTQFDRFTISYSGSLFLDFRDPRLLFRAINSLISDQKIQLNDIQFLYAGKDGKRMHEWIKSEGLDSSFVDAGFVTRPEAMEIQEKSHINLLLTSSSIEHQGLVTGKLFEYFEAGNPIICLIKGVPDFEIEAMFSTLNAGYIAYDPSDISGLKAYILLKYEEWKQTGAVQSTIKKDILIKKYSWEEQAKKIINFITEQAGDKLTKN